MSAHPPLFFARFFSFLYLIERTNRAFFFFLSQLELHVTGNEAPACTMVSFLVAPEEFFSGARPQPAGAPGKQH